ncbi:dTDP-4-dehydrorhamnose 3,5-epimerase [Nocardia salmonicida]|uniref:dTDP-4-dehydrorhamnose 3,5-epimerase family protein n=1 Tax=Nocardia salmonicida TaxID=53431 RepID=UPI0033F6801C
MEARELAVAGAFEFSPEIHSDERGRFWSPFDAEVFTKAVGHRFFPVGQVCFSRSRRGVVRGVHFTATPPGKSKYVYCVRGIAYDIVVDLRVGSPTFGAHDAVLLDQVGLRAVYLPVGVGHVFVALEDDTSVCYLLSGDYSPENEFALSPLDTALVPPLPEGFELILSERDRVAPTLAEAEASGILPAYADCLAAERALMRAGAGE